jgi:hypothetical protein
MRRHIARALCIGVALAALTVILSKNATASGSFTYDKAEDALRVTAKPQAIDHQAAPQPQTTARDGAHDFDFDIGVWHTDIVRRLHPLSGSDETMHLTGTVTVRKVWDGRAQLEEIEADGPAGHWEGMTVFLYDPKARQWSMNFANSADGKITSPMIGSFDNRRGELIAQDKLYGRSVLVRGVWSDLTPTTHTYQESYSADGGRTWEVAFTAHKTKR